MKFDDVLSTLTDDEKEIIYYIFVTSNKARRPMDFIVKCDDKVFLDETDYSGVTPLHIIAYLHNDQDAFSMFNSLQINGCRFNLEYLPSNLISKAQAIFQKHWKVHVDEDWEKEGF